MTRAKTPAKETAKKLAQHGPRRKVPDTEPETMKKPNRTPEIKDDNGKKLTIGMRVGCRQLGQTRDRSRRGLILTGYEPGALRPYITNEGAFTHAIMDHQPDMDDFIKNHVTR